MAAAAATFTALHGAVAASSIGTKPNAVPKDGTSKTELQKVRNNAVVRTRTPTRTATIVHSLAVPSDVQPVVAAPSYFLLNQAADDFSAPAPQPSTIKPASHSSEIRKESSSTLRTSVSVVTTKNKAARASPPASSSARRMQFHAGASEAFAPYQGVAPPAPRIPTDTLALSRPLLQTEAATAGPMQMPLQATERVYTGFFRCEFGQGVLVDPDAQRPGHFKLTLGQRVVPMSPVPTLAGLVRMEDANQSIVWIQLANKSMLLDHAQGLRLVDDCTVPEQITYARMLAHTPQPGLLD